MQATRALFDEQGLQEASVDAIAKAVGINKALIYRHFASKDELFVLTVTHYLDELAGRMREGVPADAAPVEQLETRLTSSPPSASSSPPSWTARCR